MTTHQRRKDDEPEEVAGIIKLNNWLRHNIHLLLLAAPLIFGTASKMGFVWTGSPQSIIKHVDEADSSLSVAIEMNRIILEAHDSAAAFRSQGLTDTVTVLWGRQEIILSVICQSLSRDAKALIANTIKCSHWTTPQNKTNTVGGAINLGGSQK